MSKIKERSVAAVVTSNPMDSIIEYECPCGECGWALEPDAGIQQCTVCGELVECNVDSAIMAGTIDEEYL